ncbi:MAG: tRNA uridine-5-carboxymethylaminomethyl(34) synthesis GTPase MnmE [Gammaproteobacteria bacterium]|nr:tRNA uridine-5-carboxymethylaminomethyl(34) synthesis GTPase MnmE [Gammaproteobacteria bacterium]MCP5425537.1 tRNA uridine-5-carboxymethylaminomethyl(34) synthesis GTPase MnmE [Gammaproteobacteria bacterium]MCP5459343.1 tRNA uridine-5-carboxymethylaminomethyl(34) synthesis GTPase MnmE [Gammaproteobacteria bacterium]
MNAPTIAAIATPRGRGGVGIVRVSGKLTGAIATGLLGDIPPPRQAVLRRFQDGFGGAIDVGIALFFPAPHSFTGEDVLELHGHGGPVVMDLLLARVLELGARTARPGEFSERAFLNDKLDLAQAEAIADLIDSQTAAAARAAMRSLQGEFSQQVQALVEALIQLRIYVEAAIDFPEEEIDFLADGPVGESLSRIIDQLSVLRAGAAQGQLLRDGMTVVIAGRPNAGKSSLLNHLAGREAAIVTDVPGTTRDVLREQINLDGMPLHVIDTAGLRDSDDPVEREGIKRAWREIETADRILLMVDDTRGVTPEDRQLHDRLPPGSPFTLIRNKIDLTERQPGIEQGSWGMEILLSVKTGAGLDILRRHLKDSMGYQGEGTFMARRRHLEALDQAGHGLQQARFQLETARAGELVAEELRGAQNALAEITGEFTSDDLLGRIFTSFCIGK